MTEAPASASPPIEQLLQERAQYEQWLARLDDAGSRAPEGVRTRVRADYQARLNSVIDQLRSHEATIGEELERQRASQNELEARQAQMQEHLAEAEVRHAVGEYGESEWERVSQESNRQLISVNEALAQVIDEIARLAEVQSLIQKAPAPAASASPVMPPPPAPEPVAPEPVAPEPVAPKAAPVAPGPVAAEPKGPPADEMAFLKSVAGAAEPPRPAAEPRPERQAAAPAPQRGGGGAAQTASAKTLKCGECGTLNRPTEWYCERCGAELAAL